MIKRTIKRILSKILSENVKDYIRIRRSRFFDRKWYKKTYHIKGNAILHYLNEGYKLDYFPSNDFNIYKYYVFFDEVRAKKMNPLLHFEKIGKFITTMVENPVFSEEEMNNTKIAIEKQNKNIINEYDANTKKLTIFLVPEIDFVGGGVMSINSIASVVKDHYSLHNSEVIICTVPAKRTFFKYTMFKSDFNIYRFDQLLTYFKSLEDVTIHIPEIYYNHLLILSTGDQIEWIKNIKHCHLNILNQNNDLMPRPREVDYLARYVDEFTITCAHEQYCTKNLRSSYNCSVHLISSSNLQKYNYINYNKKRDLIVYSIDQHPMKDQIINKLKESFNQYEFVEIKNMKYLDYLKIIGEAKYMFTFGEGLDGYFVESIRSGTMAFTVYNVRFFDDVWKGLKNTYNSYNEMLDNIVDDINYYNNNPKEYKKVVDTAFDIDKKQYDDKKYINNIINYLKGNYTYDIKDVLTEREKISNSKPLISVAMACYNGEKYIKKQIDSLLSLEYDNFEIVISDDNSTDKTATILKSYKNKIKYIINDKNNSGLNNNFINAIKNCSGEYIALCDQDDIWKPNKLNVLLNRIDDFDVVFSNVGVIDSDDNYHPEKYMHDAYEKNKARFYSFTDYIRSNEILGCSCLFKASFLKKYLSIPKDVIYHDWWFILNAIKNGNGLVFIDEELMYYRQHNTNTARNTFNSSDWFEKKVKFDKVIDKSFSLSDLEKELIDIDKNYCSFMCSFRKYMPIGFENKLEDSYYCFTNQFTSDIKNNMNNMEK